MNDFWKYLSFPLNLFTAALWMLFWGWLRKSYPNNAAVRFLLSPSATISSIVLLIASCLWIGFTGDRSFVESIIFVTVLLYVQTVLFLITLRGYRRGDGVIRWRFLFLHLGLLLAVGAGFWGSPDSEEYRLKLRCEDNTREAYGMDGAKRILPYEIKLHSLQNEYDENGKATHYEAIISMDDLKPVSVCVNDPYSVRVGEDLYLASVSEDSCVLQIVREPWRYFTLTGIILMLCGAFLLFINGPRRS